MNNNIIRKIRACLARANSPGASENEAETALRQARKLMEMHGLSETDMAASEIHEQEAHVSSNSRPPMWVAMVENLICKYFQVAAIWHVGYDMGFRREKTTVKFIGREPSAEIAAYAFQVLYRQLRRDRANHLKKIHKRTKQANRTAKADAYAEGWVISVADKVRDFLHDMNDETRTAVDAYLERKGSKPESMTPKSSTDRKGVRGIDGDRWAGFSDGKKANLNHGVGGEGDDQKVLEQL